VKARAIVLYIREKGASLQKIRNLMTLTLLSGEKSLIDMTDLDMIRSEGEVTRLFFQLGQQERQIVVRESLNEIKYLASAFDHLQEADVNRGYTQ
jgi:hypothetical protein